METYFDLILFLLVINRFFRHLMLSYVDLGIVTIVLYVEDLDVFIINPLALLVGFFFIPGANFAIL